MLDYLCQHYNVLVFIILAKSSQGQHKFEKHVRKYFFFVIGNLFSFHLKENLGYSLILDFMVLAWDRVAVFNPKMYHVKLC
jgi:hypothetical protein